MAQTAQYLPSDHEPSLLTYLYDAYIRWRYWPPEKRWLYSQYIDPKRMPQLEEIAMPEPVWGERDPVSYTGVFK